MGRQGERSAIQKLVRWEWSAPEGSVGKQVVRPERSERQSAPVKEERSTSH